VATTSAAQNSIGEADAVKQMDMAVDDFMKYMSQRYPHYQNETKIKAEVHYNSYHPFRWSWVNYLLALIFFSFFYFGSKSTWAKPAWLFLGLGMAFHVWGFALRIYILERPPITNMFETVAWVAFASIIMSIILYAFNKAKILPLASSLVATFSLILCDMSSTVLDDALTPLQPVLRDNFWLLTHVVIIVSSYAAFFLAFFIGDILLYYFYKDESKYNTEIQQGVVAIYRSIQIGVVLLALGTILGGIWADYSWGRFWGWDPKETWALIALLGYLVILHGRIIGWLKNYGLAASSVVAFSLVIMAWYGVNFVLGAGLHSYGFGAGGVEYVAGFVAIHMLAVAYVTTLRQSRLKLPKG
jgi:ABC-type transport system involved in cytochrome c biogenesis permease subunit